MFDVDDIMRVLPERGNIEQNFEKGDETHLFSSHFLLLVSRPISRVIRRSKEEKSIEFHTKKKQNKKFRLVEHEHEHTTEAKDRE